MSARTYRPGQRIPLGSNDVLTVVSGSVAVLASHRDGSTTAVGIPVHAGGLVTTAPGQWVQARTAATVTISPRSAEATPAVWAMVDRITAAAGTRHRDARHEVTAVLALIAAAAGTPIQDGQGWVMIKPPLTQTDLAQMTGRSRTTVAAALQWLGERGLVRILAPRQDPRYIVRFQ